MSTASWVSSLSPGSWIWCPHPNHEFVACQILSRTSEGFEVNLLPSSQALDALLPPVRATSPQFLPTNVKDKAAVTAIGFPVLQGQDKAFVTTAQMIQLCSPIDEQLIGHATDLVSSDSSSTSSSSSTKTLIDFADMVKFNTLSQATVINNVRFRFLRNAIYTSVSSILVSVNPYKELGLYTDKILQRFHAFLPPTEGEKETAANEDDPHLFGVCRRAYRSLVENKRDQSVLISGESGAGKSEATKLVLRYVCEMASGKEGKGKGVNARAESNTQDGSGANEQKGEGSNADAEGEDDRGHRVRGKLLKASPVLEALGNAKTVMNDNSSRFGKWIEVALDTRNGKGSVVGGTIVQYLLEESRVCVHAQGERNYHIFYQLCQHFKLDPSRFTYLRPRGGSSSSSTSTSPAIEIGSNSRGNSEHLSNATLEECTSALQTLGFDEITIQHLYNALLGILWLGNIQFKALTSDSCAVAMDDGEDTRGVDEGKEEGTAASEGAGMSEKGGTREAVKHVCEIFGINEAVLLRSLTVRVFASPRGSTMNVTLSAGSASDNRDALCKTVYGRLFEHVVKKINESIQSEQSGSPNNNTNSTDSTKGNNSNSNSNLATRAPSTIHTLSCLDVYGFEFFDHNSLEQLFINYANEKLQQHFVRQVFRMELDLYTSNNLSIENIPYFDNSKCLALIEHVQSTGFASIPQSPTGGTNEPQGILVLLNEVSLTILLIYSPFIYKRMW